jgi:hypothetical protein
VARRAQNKVHIQAANHNNRPVHGHLPVD